MIVLTLEELLGTIPKHKGTDKLRADFRKRLAKLKEGGWWRHVSLLKQTLIHPI